MQRDDLISKINAALKRMEIKGFANTVHYQRLKAKRDAVAKGQNYRVVNLTPFLVAYVGSLIPNANIGPEWKLIPSKVTRIGRTRAVFDAVRRAEESGLIQF